ncbi:hypothetical protein ACNJ7E_02405 [Rhodococcus sp. NM-2]|uniref:hypothetical protein n=1 Tax=Rhodococcus sp. NM-2 TaxID=3401174 RepID=UPI003AB07C4A
MSHPVGLSGTFVLFPCTFFGVNFGAGWPMIVALHDPVDPARGDRFDADLVGHLGVIRGTAVSFRSARR